MECRLQPNGEMSICREDILPERIEGIPASIRQERQFEEDFESAKQESTGERAFGLYNEYVQKSVIVEGENVARRFLRVAVDKQWSAALQCVDQLRVNDVEREEMQGLLTRLQRRQIACPDKIAKFIVRARQYGINKSRCAEIAAKGVESFLMIWRHRIKTNGKMCGVVCEENSDFSRRLACKFLGSDIDRYTIEWVYRLFKEYDPSDFSESDIAGLVGFFLSVVRHQKKSSGIDLSDEQFFQEACAIGEVCNVEL